MVKWQLSFVCNVFCKLDELMSVASWVLHLDLLIEIVFLQTNAVGKNPFKFDSLVIFSKTFDLPLNVFKEGILSHFMYLFFGVIPRIIS